jgi:hypothetical protein
MAPNDRWLLDFVPDQLTDGRRFRILQRIRWLRSGPNKEAVTNWNVVSAWANRPMRLTRDN